MAEEKFISKFDGTTENKLLDIINQNQGLFPFDSELNEQSQHGLTNSAIAKEINAIKDATSNNKGYFLTEEALKNAYPVANNGSKAYVGSNYPYKIYLHASGMWVNTGETGGDEGFNAGEFYTKTEIDQKTEAINTEISRVEKGANYEVLEYETNVDTTRLKVPEKNRKAGYMITYNPGTGWIKELYTGAQLTNEEWIKDENWKVEIPSEDIQGIAEEVSSLAESAASNAALAQEKAGEASQAAEQATQLVSEAQQSITEATEAAGEANAAAEAAREAVESIGEKQGAGKPVGENGSEVFNNLTDNSVEGAAYAHAEGNLTYAWGDNSHTEGSGDVIRPGKNITPESTKEEVEEAWNISQTVTLPAGQQFHMAWGENSHAEGRNNLVTGDNSHVGGYANKVKGANSIVSGHQNIVNGDNNIVEGVYNTLGKRLSNPSTQEDDWDGSCNIVTGRRHIVKGKGNAVSGMSSSAPQGTTVTGDNNLVHGYVDVTGSSNFAVNGTSPRREVNGSNNFAFSSSVVGDDNVVFNGNILNDEYSNHDKVTGNTILRGFIGFFSPDYLGEAIDNVVIEGRLGASGSACYVYRNNIVIGGTAVGSYNVAIGGGQAGGSTVIAMRAIAIGYRAEALDVDSIVLGNGTVDYQGGIAIGNAAAHGGGIAISQNSLATTGGSTAYGKNSIAIGENCTAKGDYSCSMGNGNTSHGGSSFAACSHNTAVGNQSIAMGINAVAYGNYAVALGGGGLEASPSITSGKADIEGIENEYFTSYNEQLDSIHVAAGRGSMVTGKNCLALGNYSSAHGEGNVAYKDHQFVVGKFGQFKENIAFAVGWGTYYGNRLNAFEVLNDGNANLKGTLNQSSDIRLKENVKDLESKGSLRIAEFDWKNGNGHSYGFIADEVEKIYPDMVSENSSGYKVLNYNAAMCAKLAELENTIKKQQEMIDKLEKLI